jgi:hypothetical protein
MKTLSLTIAWRLAYLQDRGGLTSIQVTRMPPLSEDFH